jgi:hypothetical protein
MPSVQGPRVPRPRDSKATIGWRYGLPIIVTGGKGVKLSICMPKRHCAHSARPLPPEPVEGILWHGGGEAGPSLRGTHAPFAKSPPHRAPSAVWRSKRSSLIMDGGDYTPIKLLRQHGCRAPSATCWEGQGERSCDGATDVDLLLDGRMQNICMNCEVRHTASPCSWVNLRVSCRDEDGTSNACHCVGVTG